jgi:hypothetical protein
MHHTKPIIVSLRKLTSCLSGALFTKFFLSIALVWQCQLCYLEVICTKIPKLVEREKIGDGVRGEPGRIVQGDLEAEGWMELSLDSVVANFIHMDAVVVTDSAELETMATVKVVDCDDAPRGDTMPLLQTHSGFYLVALSIVCHASTHITCQPAFYLCARTRFSMGSQCILLFRLLGMESVIKLSLRVSILSCPLSRRHR